MPISEAQLTACYQDSQRRLYNVLHRLLWNAQDCQDVMHEAFMQVWRRREKVEAARLEALVFTAALNLARNQLRWRSLRSFAGIEDNHCVTAAADDESPAIKRALGQLPLAQRQVLLLSEIAGFSTREIAAMLGIPEGTVGSRKHQALARMRDFMEPSQ